MLGVELFAGSTAPATEAAPSLTWVALLAAVIGAAFAQVPPFLKDWLLPIINENRSQKNDQQRIVRNYLAPLADSGGKLVWRLKEIFIQHRHQWLLTKSLPLDFNEYKRQSTIYRIACLLGWIRALSCELSALPQGQGVSETAISRAIEDVRGALADGPEVEQMRLKRLCSVWDIDLKLIPEEKLKSVAVQLEVKVFAEAGNELRSNSFLLESLTIEKRKMICLSLSRFLSSEFGRAQVSEQIIGEKLNQAIAWLAYHEAWIYRDWQDAIGDALLERDEASVRRFKTIGYAEFVKNLEEGTPWFLTLRDLVTDVDFDQIHPNDFRVTQLRKFSKSISILVEALAASREGDLVSIKTLDAAKTLNRAL